MTNPGHEALLSSAPTPPRTAADELLRTFHEVRDGLVSTLWYLLGNEEDARDAAQDAFLKCWRARGSLAEVRDLRAWIFRVGLNVARDQQRGNWYRRSQQFAGEDACLMERGASPDDVAEQQETLSRLRHALVGLRPDEKEVFLLRQNGDLTFEQIAELRCCPLGTVKTQMRSALQKLRRVLAEPPAETVPGKGPNQPRAGDSGAVSDDLFARGSYTSVSRSPRPWDGNVSRL